MNKLEENINNFLPLNRKERFFTGTILPQIICYKNFKYLNYFTGLIDKFPDNLSIKPNPDENNIQFFTEYSLKESIVPGSSSKKYVKIPESKDTPDLVILITEPELILIVVEAKVYSSSDASTLTRQMDNQRKIIDSIKETLNIADENIYHIGLVPSKLIKKQFSTKYQIIYWEDILDAYLSVMSEDYFYNILKLAIEKFDSLVSRNSQGFSSYGKNMDTKLSGKEIVKLCSNGESFWVGRNRGLYGAEMIGDKTSGRWRSHKYEINLTAKEAPNKNWFSVKQFVNFVGAFSTRTNSEEERTPSPLLHRNPNIQYSNLDDWHFSHLGRDYFLDVASNCGLGRSLDVPIDTVFIGKKGVPYKEKRNGRNVNPNWAVIRQDGRELKCKIASNTMERGLWKRSNCHAFSWDEIVQFFNNQIYPK